METYKGYWFGFDKSGFAPNNSKVNFFSEEEDFAIGSGESIEDCKKQIDEIILEQIKEKLEFDFGWSNLDCEDKKWFVDNLILDVHSICTQSNS
jgi:hypothetical protein